MAGGTGRVRIVGGRIVDEAELARKRVVGALAGIAALVCAGAAGWAGVAWWGARPPQPDAAVAVPRGASATMTATSLDEVPSRQIDAGETARVARDIRSAVAATIDAGATSRPDQPFVAALRAELKQKVLPPQSPQAALDRMAKDQREAHATNVLNRVIVAARAVDPTNPGVPGDALRNTIHALLDDAGRRDKPGAADAAFVAALTPEVRDRENETRTITVQAGDSLSAIAMRAYGDPNRYMKIFEANPRVLTNPHQLYIGMVLRVPI